MSSQNKIHEILINSVTVGTSLCSNLEITFEKPYCADIICVYENGKIIVSVPPGCSDACFYANIKCLDENPCSICPDSERIKICPCKISADCPDCSECVDGLCITLCDPDEICVSGNCQDCDGEHPCLDGKICSNGKCNCPPSKPVIHPITKQCVECIPGTKDGCLYCNPDGNWEDYECPEGVCDPDSTEEDPCVECLKSGDCGPNEICSNGKTCDCKSGFVRDENGVCVQGPECDRDSDCEDCEYCNSEGNCTELVTTGGQECSDCEDGGDCDEGYGCKGGKCVKCDEQDCDYECGITNGCGCPDEINCEDIGDRCDSDQTSWIKNCTGGSPGVSQGGCSPLIGTFNVANKGIVAQVTSGTVDHSLTMDHSFTYTISEAFGSTCNSAGTWFYSPQYGKEYSIAGTSNAGKTLDIDLTSSPINNNTFGFLMIYRANDGREVTFQTLFKQPTFSGSDGLVGSPKGLQGENQWVISIVGSSGKAGSVIGSTPLVCEYCLDNSDFEVYDYTPITYSNETIDQNNTPLQVSFVKGSSKRCVKLLYSGCGQWEGALKVKCLDNIVEVPFDPIYVDEGCCLFDEDCSGGPGEGCTEPEVLDISDYIVAYPFFGGDNGYSVQIVTTENEGTSPVSFMDLWKLGGAVSQCWTKKGNVTNGEGIQGGPSLEENSDLYLEAALNSSDVADGVKVEFCFGEDCNAKIDSCTEIQGCREIVPCDTQGIILTLTEDFNGFLAGSIVNAEVFAGIEVGDVVKLEAMYSIPSSTLAWNYLWEKTSGITFSGENNVVTSYGGKNFYVSRINGTITSTDLLEEIKVSVTNPLCSDFPDQTESSSIPGSTSVPNTFVQFNAACPEVPSFSVNAIFNGVATMPNDTINLCGSTNLDYTISVVGGSPNYSYNIKAPGGGIVFQSSNVVSSLVTGTVLNAVAGQYTVEVYANSQNCVSMTNYIVAIKGTVLPTVVVNSPVCSGSSQIITFTSGGDSSGMQIYYTVNGTPQTVVIPIGQTAKTVNLGSVISLTTIAITGYEYTDGCAVTLDTPITQTISVISSPTISSISADSSHCYGDDLLVTITGTPTATGKVNGINFTIGGGGTVDVTIPSGSINLGSFSINVTNVYLGSCSGTGASLVIGVFNKPTITSIVKECSDDFLTYKVTFNSSVTASGLSVVPTYSITDLGGNSYEIDGVAIADIIFITASTTDCDVEVMVSPPSCTCGTIPTPTNPVDDQYCAGDLGDVTVSVDSLAGHTVHWETFGGSFLYAGSSYTFTPSGSVALYARYVLDSNNSCVSDRIQANVTQLVRPTISNSTVNTCVGANVILTIGSIGNPNCVGTSGFTYSWSGPNGFTATTSTASINNVTAAKSGDYIVTVTDCEGCESLPATITLTSSCCVDINEDGSSQLKCAGDTVTLVGTVTGGVANYTYAFKNPLGTTIQSGSSSGNVITSTPISLPTTASGGDYTLEVTDSNGCMFIATYTVYVTDYVVTIGTYNCISNTAQVTATGNIVPANSLNIPILVGGVQQINLSHGVSGTINVSGNLSLTEGGTYNITNGGVCPGTINASYSATTPCTLDISATSYSLSGGLSLSSTGGSGSIVFTVNEVFVNPSKTAVVYGGTVVGGEILDYYANTSVIVTGTDDCGCTDTVVINPSTTAISLVNFYVDASESAGCGSSGANDLKGDVTTLTAASGGTAPYTWYGITDSSKTDITSLIGTDDSFVITKTSLLPSGLDFGTAGSAVLGYLVQDNAGNTQFTFLQTTPC